MISPKWSIKIFCFLPAAKFYSVYLYIWMTIKPVYARSEIWTLPDSRKQIFIQMNTHPLFVCAHKQPSLSNPACDTDCMNAVDHKPDINQLSGEKKSPSFI